MESSTQVNLSPDMALGSPLWIPKKRTTVLAAIVATIGSFGLGTVLTWSAPAIPDMKASGQFGEITTTQSSLIASLAMLGALISAPVAGFCISKFGRRTFMLMLGIPFVIGWAIIAFAYNLPMIYAGRIITGFCGGAFTVAVPAYVSEITEDKIRGTLSTVMILMLCSGILFTFVLGTYLTWYWLSIACGCIPIVFFFSMLFMPESPRYLLSTGNATQASKALEWLRRASKKRYIEPELSQIENSIENSNCQSSNWRDLCTQSVLWPVVICSGLIFFQQLSGVNGVSFYTVDVFKSAGTEMDANIVSIIIGACQVLTVFFVPTVLVDKVGRKILLVTSEVIMVLSLIALGTYFYLLEQNNNVAPESLSWLPLISLISYIIGYNIGMGPLPWLVMSDCLPHHVKELASSTIATFYWILSFIAAQTFQELARVMGWSGLYWFSAGICILGTVFIIFLLPETKGKTSEEVQEMLKNRIQFKTHSRILSKEMPVGVDNKTFEI